MSAKIAFGMPFSITSPVDPYTNIAQNIYISHRIFIYRTEYLFYRSMLLLIKITIIKDASFQTSCSSLGYTSRQ